MPDSAYAAELLPTKKPNTFAIQAFRQINGEFIDDNEFIPANVDKLIKKFDPDEYHLILPDFLFTNTIVDIKETEESVVKKYLKEKLLPELGLTKDTHEVDTFILTQYQGKSKVQLSALERSLMAPVQKAAAEHKLTIAEISPLSWTIKSVISLEPSLSTIQIGSRLYLAQHYIGVDQTISFSIEETENIAETVKTLKGAEPNIQTMYLLTNGLVENTIKEKLSGTLPIQQLANFSDETEGIPSYIKQIIEASAKTLSIPELVIPRFKLEKYEGPFDVPATVAEVKEKEEKEEKAQPKPIHLDDDNEEEMPIPSMPIVKPAELPKPNAALKVEAAPEVPVSPVKIEPVHTPPALTPSLAPAPIPAPALISPPIVKPENVVPFTQPMTDSRPMNPIFTNPSMPPTIPNHEVPRQVIKNKSDAGSLIKVVAITIGALVVTVALGVGIGFGLLTLSEKKSGTAMKSASPTASPIATVAPTPTATPTPTPVAIDKAKTKILVVNATKTSGLAGKMKKSLTDAGYKSVDTGNAKGTYTTSGTFVLLDKNDAGMVASFSKDTGNTLTYATGKDTEDPSGKYDAVIVLNQ